MTDECSLVPPAHQHGDAAAHDVEPGPLLLHQLASRPAGPLDDDGTTRLLTGGDQDLRLPPFFNSSLLLSSSSGVAGLGCGRWCWKKRLMTFIGPNQ
jgi:hypothetical protein